MVSIWACAGVVRGESRSHGQKAFSTGGSPLMAKQQRFSQNETLMIEGNTFTYLLFKIGFKFVNVFDVLAHLLGFGLCQYRTQQTDLKF
jgi:hypothetical protein